MLNRAMRIPKKLFPLLRKNKVYEGEFFSIRVTFSKNEDSPSKGVCIVSKKISKFAVNRNKTKRRVYSIMYSRLAISKNVSLQIFPKKQSQKTSYKKLQDDLIQIIEKNNIL
jgi:ribonuclease P protein component